jgi:hypothetical protein
VGQTKGLGNLDKRKFIETAHCTSRAHCQACREDPKFRQAIREAFEVPLDFDMICTVTATPLSPSRPVASSPPPVSIPAPLPIEQPTGPLVTVTVTGFVGNNAPNGSWTLNPPGGTFGNSSLLVKFQQMDSHWRLEIFKKCCGGRLKLCAAGDVPSLGSAFEVLGAGDFVGQKGFGSVI